MNPLRKQKNVGGEDVTIINIVQARIDTLQKSKVFKQECDNEFAALIKAITDIEYITKNEFGGFCTIYFSEIATSFINMIDVQESNSSPEMTEIGLIILRKIIESENKEESVVASHKPCYLWESDEWDFYKDNIVKMQNQLADLGLVELLGKVISHDDYSRHLKNEAILVCIALLLCGNEKVQGMFHEYMTQDK